MNNMANTQVKPVIAKLGGMRKTQEWFIYPRKQGEPIIAQCDRAIAQVDPQTGKGLLNWKGSGGKYFMHLSKFMGAEDYQFDDIFIAACLARIPESGDHIGGEVYIA